MASAPHAPATKPDDWIAVATRELRDLTAAYTGKATANAKCDHAVRAVEAALKAVLWKRNKWPKWPGKEKGFKYLYNHNLEAMLDQCGQDLRDRLQASADHLVSWRVLVNAVVKHYRYSVTPPSDAEANEIAKSCRHPDLGVVPWLLKRYQEIT